MDNQTKYILNMFIWVVLPKVIVGIEVIGFVIYFMGIIDFNNIKLPLGEIIIGSLIILPIWISIGSIQKYKTCSNCKKWSGLKLVNKQLINKENVTIEKTVKDKVYNDRNRTNPSYIERKVYVPGIRYTYNVEYKCKKCGFVEYKVESRDVENTVVR